MKKRRDEEFSYFAVNLMLLRNSSSLKDVVFVMFIVDDDNEMKMRIKVYIKFIVGSWNIFLLV
jgi:hypothetical protein